MAELFGAILRAIGGALASIHAAFGSYALAIILVTIGVRVLLLPLTIKSTRSMAAMQKAQPEIKRVQNKYKDLQKKARDRQEIQQLRLDMNREMQEVMRAHGASFSGGCLPMLAQFPVLIAMFTVMRVAIPVQAVPVETIRAEDFGGTSKLKTTLCRPVDESGNLLVPSNDAATPTRIRCDLEGKEPKVYILNTTTLIDPNTNEKVDKAGWISVCQPAQPKKDDPGLVFACRSALGTGHLPRDSELFQDVSADRATLFGMHPGCTATQAGSKEKAQECTTDPRGGGGDKSIPYYLLILLILGTSYYSSKQLNQRTLRTGGTVGPQQQMMARIMPLFFGLISINLPAGANLYFLVQNLWQIGQQFVQFKIQDRENATEIEEPKSERKPEPRSDSGEPPRPPRPQQGSKKKKRKKRR